MKYLLKTIKLIFLLLFVFNCSNDDDSPENSSQQFSPELLNGTWRVSLFTDEDSDLTSEFNGYEFTFNVEEQGTVVTYNGNQETALVEVYQEAINGETIWVVYTDFDDNPGDAPLGDLSEDWFITNINNTATVIKFEELYSNVVPEVMHLTRVQN